jgi:hypothetical protein
MQLVYLSNETVKVSIYRNKYPRQIRPFTPMLCRHVLQALFCFILYSVNASNTENTVFACCQATHTKNKDMSLFNAMVSNLSS